MNAMDVKGCGIMLLRFRFKNFKSFSEDTELDLMATNIKEHVHSLIEVNGNRVLPLVAIFGANGSGKSNVFSAFKAMGNDIVNKFDKQERHVLIIPFVFNEQKRDEPSEFEVCVNILDHEYRYGFARNQEQVIEEWLFEKKFHKTSKSKEKCIYHRSHNGISMDRNLSAEKLEIQFVNSMLEKTELLLSALGRRNKSRYSCVYEWFVRIAQIQDFSNDMFEWVNISLFAKYLYNQAEILEDVIALLREFDDAIVTLKIEREIGDDLNEEYKIYSIHRCDDHEEMLIPFESESSGTKKIFSLAVYLLISINSGTVLFVDELDSKLHPLALRYLLRLYSDRNKNIGHGQLIFSSHNLVCLDSSDLRRDEIWFVEKNNQVSTMYSLYDFDDCGIRSDLSFGKHYLSGRFGAVPFQKSEE